MQTNRKLLKDGSLIDGTGKMVEKNISIDILNEDVVSKKEYLTKSSSFPRIITTGKFFSAPGGYGGMQPIPILSVEEAEGKVNEVDYYDGE